MVGLNVTAGKEVYRVMQKNLMTILCCFSCTEAFFQTEIFTELAEHIRATRPLKLIFIGTGIKAVFEQASCGPIPCDRSTFIKDLENTHRELLAHELLRDGQTILYSLYYFDPSASKQEFPEVHTSINQIIQEIIGIDEDAAEKFRLREGLRQLGILIHNCLETTSGLVRNREFNNLCLKKLEDQINAARTKWERSINSIFHFEVSKDRIFANLHQMIFDEQDYIFPNPDMSLSYLYKSISEKCGQLLIRAIDQSITAEIKALKSSNKHIAAFFIADISEADHLSPNDRFVGLDILRVYPRNEGSEYNSRWCLARMCINLSVACEQLWGNFKGSNYKDAATIIVTEYMRRFFNDERLTEVRNREIQRLLIWGKEKFHGWALPAYARMQKMFDEGALTPEIEKYIEDVYAIPVNQFMHMASKIRTLSLMHE